MCEIEVAAGLKGSGTALAMPARTRRDNVAACFMALMRNLQCLIMDVDE
jgi:hypothetical protein